MTTRVSALTEFIGREYPRTTDAYELGDRVASYLYERELINSEKDALRAETLVIRALAGGTTTSDQLARLIVAEFHLDKEN